MKENIGQDKCDFSQGLSIYSCCSDETQVNKIQFNFQDVPVYQGNTCTLIWTKHNGINENVSILTKQDDCHPSGAAGLKLLRPSVENCLPRVPRKGTLFRWGLAAHPFEAQYSLVVVAAISLGGGKGVRIFTAGKNKPCWLEMHSAKRLAPTSEDQESHWHHLALVSLSHQT